MTARPAGPLRVSLWVVGALSVMLGLFGIAAFWGAALLVAWFQLMIVVPLIGGIPVPVPVLLAEALVAFAAGLLVGFTAGSLVGLIVSLILFFTAGVCGAFAARSRADRRSKMVRS